MTLGYYDYHPLVTLERPIVVTGWLTSDSRAAAYRISAMTGLRFTDVDRLVEHRTGGPIEELVRLEGETRYRQLESECLERELRDTPAGIVSLGDGALMQARNLDQVRSRATIVLLNLDLANLYWRIRSRVNADPEVPWHPLHPTLPASLDDLRPYYDRRKAGFEIASYRIEVRGLSPEGAARSVLKRLPELRID
jgi:shikimate kinase